MVGAFPSLDDGGKVSTAGTDLEGRGEHGHYLLWDSVRFGEVSKGKAPCCVQGTVECL